MLLALISLVGLASLAPLVRARTGGAAGWLLALLPAGLALYFASLVPAALAGTPVTSTFAWIPSLGIEAAFRADALSLLFALLVTGVGALVVVYAAAYLGDHPRSGRFLGALLLFMAAMLGVVLADDLYMLFVCWEVTSFSSYLLIGFEHERAAARKAALTALVVTGFGGLAMLAGFVLLADAAGTARISELVAQRELLVAHSAYVPALLLILLGAFTKSAQFPFHFWLPTAMEAPTPASTYLHAATMVKAGVYLLARLLPVLGGTELWHVIVTTAGAATLVTGALLSLQPTEFKRVLAWSTVASLGLFVMLLGIGTRAAVGAALVSLAAHALYKGTLFLVAGIVTHETGSKDSSAVGGLRSRLPLVAAAALVAAVSMAGLPPALGFVGKELAYDAARLSLPWGTLLIAATVAASALLVSATLVVAVRPWFGALRLPPADDHGHGHAAHHGPGPGLLAGPLALAALGLAFGLFPPAMLKGLLEGAATAAAGAAVTLDLSLWHGFTPALMLSGLTLVAGLAIFAVRRPLLAIFAPLGALALVGPGRIYAGAMNALYAFAAWSTRCTQTGYLRHYIGVFLAVAVGLVGYVFFTRVGAPAMPPLGDLQVIEGVFALLILSGTLLAVTTSSRLVAIAGLGVVGFSVAALFARFGAPDLAMTQFVIESLTLILLALVLARLPKFADYSRPWQKARDAVLAGGTGLFLAALVAAASQSGHAPPVSAWHMAKSKSEAHGANVVNVILVDFRALDTLGEITVLAVAGVGVFALLRLRGGRSGEAPQ